MAETKTPHPGKPKRGFVSFLPLIAVLIVGPVAGWFALGYFQKQSPPKPQAAKDKAEAAESKEKGRSRNVPSGVPVPVTDRVLTFIPGDSSKAIPPRVVSTNAFLANSLKPEKFFITFADTKKKHQAVAQLYLVAGDTDALIRKMNDLVSSNQSPFFETLTNLLSSKFYRDTKSPGFRKLLRLEVLGLASQILGANLVQDVIIAEFITQ